MNGREGIAVAEGSMRCAVCGAVQPAGADCPECGFARAFVRRFADGETLRAWQDRRRRALMALYAAGGRLSIGRGSVAVIRPGRRGAALLTLKAGMAQTMRRADAALCSVCGDREAVSAGELRSVHAGGDAVFTVGMDGRVAVQWRTGVNPPAAQAAIPDKWRHVRSITSSRTCVAAVTEDGRVLVAAAASTGMVQQASVEDWQGIRALAAADSFLLGLTEDGRVLCAGGGPALAEMQKQTALWQGMTAVTAASRCAVGLTEDGRVLLAGGLLAQRAHRDHVAAWQDVVAIAGSDSGELLAMDSRGRVLCSGGSPQLAKAVEELNQAE